MSGDISALVGNTPVVQINCIINKPDIKIFAKLEGHNPGGSVKDRIAKFMIEAAIESGDLTKDKIILEPTSGNTGIGLAMMAVAKGFRIKIVMPESMSMERRQMLMAFGVELVLTPAEEGMNGAIAKAEKMSKDPKYFMPHQFENLNNVKAHYEGTGPEILRQVPDIDYFIAGMGTTGTIVGAGRRLKESKPGVKIIAIEPFQKSKIQGLKNLDEGYIPSIFDPDVMDEKINISDDEAFEMANNLVINEGIFVGISSGAAMAGVKRVTEKIDKGNIVVIFPDRGDRYLSTNLFNCDECKLKGV